MSLKIAVIYEPPKTTHCAFNDSCPLRGSGVDYTNLLCQALNLNCTYSWYNSSDYGDYVNDTSSGLIGAIQRGEFDTSIPVFTPTYRRSKIIDFSQLYDISETVLMTRAPNFVKDELNLSLVLAFQGSVWLAFSITMLATAFVIRIITDESSKYLHQNVSGTVSFFDLCRSLITNEFNESHMRLTSTRIVVSSWILGALVLTSGYTSMLFSKTIFFKNHLPFTDLETFSQCLQRDQCRIITHTTTNTIMQQLLASDSIKASVDKYPIRVMPADRIAEAILNETNQYLVNAGSSDTRLALVTGNRGCLFYTVSMSYFETYAFPLAKNSSYLKKFNKLLSTSRETGLVRALNRKYASESMCKAEWSSTKPSKVRLDDGQMLLSMAALFYFYILGIFIGSVVLAIEMMTYYFVSVAEMVVHHVLSVRY